MKKLAFGAAVLVILAGCESRRNAIAFDEQYFRTNVSKVDGDRAVFTVRVRDVSRSLDGAREAARHAGNSYCIGNYGSSDILWTVGPDTPQEALPISDDAIVFKGVCPQGQTA
ncbi:MAG: hypothetical protein AAF943_15080 [Pseudomonadota bacterium]